MTTTTKFRVVTGKLHPVQLALECFCECFMQKPPSFPFSDPPPELSRPPPAKGEGERVGVVQGVPASYFLFDNKGCDFTLGTIKGLTNNQLEEIGCQIILGNTYHLALRPGAELIDDLGGLHKFMNWKRALLTDSGGFQMVSLLHLADITEQGVTFQNKIGADIIMALDDVVKTTITGPRIEEAMYRTLRWIDRCIAAMLLVVLQAVKIKILFGVLLHSALLHYQKINPDIALGADMYDCVYPTRTARFGTALVPEGVLRLKNQAMANDERPIDSTCTCMLSKDLHTSIVEGQFPEFVQRFLRAQFPKGNVPQWVCNAMEVAGVDISTCCAPITS
ncbi:hypothetical protein MUK42_11588 [Musa troglodytarum]|uniref:tRNA-guanine(15) transglycosylase-like domain-containing protein n=1 Tax=Musa troglodytarum TaxID=320322 RepID=A0A9E7GQ60_9LILI|nr:hypothetical protein MUK42_11588 [Musa troglodytarum]